MRSTEGIAGVSGACRARPEKRDEHRDEQPDAPERFARRLAHRRNALAEVGPVARFDFGRHPLVLVIQRKAKQLAKLPFPHRSHIRLLAWRGLRDFITERLDREHQEV